jgi:hypothetical protein
MHHYQISLTLQADGRYLAKCDQCGAAALILFTARGIISERVLGDENLDLTKDGICKEKS